VPQNDVVGLVRQSECSQPSSNLRQTMLYNNGIHQNNDDLQRIHVVAIFTQQSAYQEISANFGSFTPFTDVILSEHMTQLHHSYMPLDVTCQIFH